MPAAFILLIIFCRSSTAMGSIPENGRFLGEIADPELPCPPVHGHVGDVFLIDEDSARIGGYQADNHIEGGGLAGTVRSKQSNNFALPDANTYSIYNSAAAVRLTDFLCGQ